jgi:signal transduction histidine kinase
MDVVLPGVEPVTGRRNDLADVARGIAAELESVAAAQETATETLLEEVGMLRVLASLGIMIAEFTHEIRQTLGSAHLNARKLATELPEDSALRQAAEDLFQNIQRFRAYASYFHRAVSENTRRELVPQDIGRVVRDFTAVVQPAAEAAGISIKTQTDGFRLLTVPMHWSEWASVLFNFYSNSQKAIKRANTHGRILMRAGRVGRRVYLEFADNGSGIHALHRERIFDAFFTTTNPAGPYTPLEEQAEGTGLGLRIVKDIAQGYGGDVFLTDPPDGYSTAFRVEFPAASQEQEDVYDR